TDSVAKGDADAVAFQEADRTPWRQAFFDPGTQDWSQRWFLDGEVGKVTNDSNGMRLSAGPEFKNNAHHMVLWTKDSFQGDLKIEYDYTRLDTETRCVNILYIQATGSGTGPYEEDIFKWRELRRVPAMSEYFNHMKAYHISYAAFPNNENATSYLRGRRYLPETSGLKGTELTPDYYPQRLFKPRVPHHITVIKKPRDLYLRVSNDQDTEHFHLKNESLPEIDGGRIGLRHMYTRSALYKNFRVSVAK
ncbi:MAG: DUF1961 family protein, partial [Planctomycetota bacterium]